MDKGRGAQRQPLGAPEWLGSYRPSDVDPAMWQSIRPFVWDCVRRLGFHEESVQPGGWSGSWLG